MVAAQFWVSDVPKHVGRPVFSHKCIACQSYNPLLVTLLEYARPLWSLQSRRQPIDDHTRRRDNVQLD